MTDNLFLKFVSWLKYSMKDPGKSDLSSPKYFLQIFIPGILFLKFINPNFHSAESFTIGIIMYPILFIVTGYIYNKLYDFFKSTKD